MDMTLHIGLQCNRSHWQNFAYCDTWSLISKFVFHTMKHYYYTKSDKLVLHKPINEVTCIWMKENCTRHHNWNKLFFNTKSLRVFVSIFRVQFKIEYNISLIFKTWQVEISTRKIKHVTYTLLSIILTTSTLKLSFTHSIIHRHGHTLNGTGIIVQMW